MYTFGRILAFVQGFAYAGMWNNGSFALLGGEGANGERGFAWGMAISAVPGMCRAGNSPVKRAGRICPLVEP